MEPPYDKLLDKRFLGHASLVDMSRKSITLKVDGREITYKKQMRGWDVSLSIIINDVTVFSGLGSNSEVSKDYVMEWWAILENWALQYKERERGHFLSTLEDWLQQFPLDDDPLPF